MNEILVVVDSSETSSQIISFAVGLAKKMNSYVTLAWVNDSNLNDEIAVNDFYQNKYDETINSYSELLDPVFFELRILPKSPSIELFKLIKNLEIDMVLIKKYNEIGALKKMFNDYPLQLQAQIECPIIVFPTNYINNGISRVVLPIDSNKNTQQKIPIATILSKKYDADMKAIFFTDNNESGSLDQKGQCLDYMARYKVSKFEENEIIGKINTKQIINAFSSQDSHSAIIVIMKDNITDSVFKKYTFTQKLIIESNSPVLSMSGYKSKAVKSKKYFKL